MRARRLAIAVVVASAAAPAASLAQVLPPPPTHAAAVAADTRQGATFTAADGTTIFYQVTGSGTPLVLIHGYPLTGALFGYQQTALAGRFQVITLDLPGFGRSGAPHGVGTPALYAGYVLALMNHLGIDGAVIGGHSMGGIITQELYREAPTRFAGMILIDTIAMAASPIEQGEWLGYAVQGVTDGPSSIIDTITPQLLTGDVRHGAPAVLAAISDQIAEGSTAGILAGAQVLAFRSDYTAQLPRIAVPTLVIEGLEDPVYGFPIAQAIAAQIPGATFALIPAASHASVFERPGATDNAILGWAAGSGL